MDTYKTAKISWPYLNCTMQLLHHSVEDVFRLGLSFNEHCRDGKILESRKRIYVLNPLLVLLFWNKEHKEIFYGWKAPLDET